MGLKQTLHLKRLNANQKGADNRNWKGDNVKYAGLHRWVRDNLFRPERCAQCNLSASREVANLDGKYSRDLNTWAWLCHKCHVRLDDIAKKAWATKRNRKEPSHGA